MQVLEYKIDLDVDFASSSFDGKTTITLADVPKKDITLNSVDLEIARVELNGTVAAHHAFSDREELVVTNAAFEGDVELVISYSGKASDLLTGLYKARYKDGLMLSTQFEAVGARRLFPCIDDPLYKAEFTLAVSVEKPFQVISNMPPARVEDIGESRRYDFPKTPRMSTYLLYLGIGQFVTEEERSDRASLAVIGVKPNDAANLALDDGRKFLRFFEDYFRIAYPLPKMDFIAVPDFGAGAMENWGAITFREIYLYSDSSTSTAVKRRASEVMAHEISHQWFGDLVTMKSWNDIWLNESFATLMAYKCIDATFPDWKQWNNFLLGDVTFWLTHLWYNGGYTGAMALDSLECTHPIALKISRTSDIDQMFDDITYGKGCSVLKMTEDFLGPENFRKGISSYLSKYAYGNAESSDLWDELAKASGVSLGSFMKAWIESPGYPLVEVKLLEKEKKLVIKQRRFLLKGAGRGSDPVWVIPLKMMIGKESKSILLENREVELSIDDPSALIKLNLGLNGFYRVLYSVDLFERLKQHMSELSSLERFGLLDDLFNLALSGDKPLDDLLGLIDQMSDDLDWFVLGKIVDILDFLLSVLPMRQDLLSLSKSFFKGQVDRLGTIVRPEDTRFDCVLRGKLLATYARIDDWFADELSKSYRNYEQLDSDTKEAVLVAVARHGGSEALEELMKRLRSSTSPEDRIRVLSSLFHFKERELASLAYLNIFNGESKKQDWVYLITSPGKNTEIRDLAWLWTKIFAAQVAEQLRGSYQPVRIFMSILPLIGLGREEEVKEFFSENKFEGADRGIERGLELLEVTSKFANKYAQSQRKD